ncbi:LysR substrate-binding domain-containing protein [Cupriavidus sp. D39]|uniref:LysR substrate-binding domain-containing protein n=1 Tax=Cupriavidus sp. D39 TaxID=2997877 RepID=UPI002D1E4AA4|nr:LysR substrate-binding domain-containing protein [Cupriavidus sp. D39]
MISTRIGLLREVVCASPAYLKKREAPGTPDDLLSHDCVTYERYAVGSNWEFPSRGRSLKVEVPSRLVVDSVEAAVVAAAEAAGIARVASYQIEELVKSGSLVMLLEAFEPLPAPVNLMYAGQGQIPLKLRAFIDFAVPRLRERLGLAHAAGPRTPHAGVQRRHKKPESFQQPSRLPSVSERSPQSRRCCTPCRIAVENAASVCGSARTMPEA